MESDRDVFEHESSAKRAKLDFGAANLGDLCDRRRFTTFSNTQHGPIDTVEGLLADCDSGYEASTLESIPTSSHHTSPQTEPGDISDNLSSLSEIFMTPSRTEMSQDSTEIDDDNTSTVSEISGLSDLSGLDWKPMAGSMRWIQKQMHNGVNPRELLGELGVDLKEVPQYVEEVTLWKLIINMLAEPPRRNKLRHINSLEDVVRLVKGAKNIIVLTGAGVSVSCGIPDFRSRDGIYVRLAKDFPDLPDPQAMFDINYFSQDPRPFFKFARDIYPGKFQPSPCHRFIKLLEKHGKLLRNYTQNIDTLEKEADIQRVIECHGSFATATCTKCAHKVTAEAIRDIVLAQRIPLCEKCHPERCSVPSQGNNAETNIDYRQLVSDGIMKPDIVFFGEGLPDTFHAAMSDDKKHCDLLLVIGSSLKVRPVALIPSSLPAHVPQILINREPLPHCHFDVELLGDCDVIINYLCHLFGGVWKEGIFDEYVLEETAHLSPLDGATSTSSPSKECGSISPRRMHGTETSAAASECCSNVKCSSFLSSPKSQVDSSSCACYVNYKEQRSIMMKQSSLDNDSSPVNCLDLKAIKERHMSVDSTRDSGIEENSNLTDGETKYDEYCTESQCTITTGDSNAEEINLSCCESASEAADLKGFWQPKIKKSLADCLPPHSFYHIKPNRYIFPGAEITYDPDDSFPFNDSSSTSSNSESDSETEQANDF